MRELEIKIPCEREGDVLGVLQGEACQLKNVARVSDGINSIISAYLFHEVGCTPYWIHHASISTQGKQPTCACMRTRASMLWLQHMLLTCCMNPQPWLGQEVGYVLNALDKVGCGTAYGKVAVLPVLLLKPLPRPTKQERHLRFLVSPGMGNS